jgi:formate dehydrogenase major subunit
MERIAKLVKEDRDKNFIAKNKDGLTVNRWVSTGEAYDFASGEINML